MKYLFLIYLFNLKDDTKNQVSINDFKKTNYAQGFGHLFDGLTTYDVNSLVDLGHALSQACQKLSPSLVSVNINEEVLPPFKSFKQFVAVMIS